VAASQLGRPQKRWFSYGGCAVTYSWFGWLRCSRPARWCGHYSLSPVPVGDSAPAVRPVMAGSGRSPLDEDTRDDTIHRKDHRVHGYIHIEVDHTVEEHGDHPRRNIQIARYRSSMVRA